MLPLDDRRLLSDALAPPPGYEADQLVATTYTLDLVALMGVPLALTPYGADLADRPDRAGALALLEALRRFRGRFAVFCQAGCIKVPRRPHPLYAMLEEAVVPVAPDGDGVFHPKLFVVRYAGEGRAPRYRVICLSRNITADEALDTLLVLEGAHSSRRRPTRNDRLVEFLHGLSSLVAHGPLPEGTAKLLALAGEELPRVEFVPPDGFTSMRFHLLGMGSADLSPFPHRVDRALAMAPFVRWGFLKRFGQPDRGDVLISREDELAELPRDPHDVFDEVLVMKQELEPEPGQPDDPIASPADGPSGLHAKLYILERGDSAHVFIGSPNASDRAFRANVELMVELKGPRTEYGISALLHGPDGNGGLEQGFVPWDRTDRPEDVLRDLERRADSLARDFGAVRLVGRVTTDPHEDGLYMLELTACSMTLPAGKATWEAWPVTVPAARAVPLNVAGPILCSFGCLRADQLTPFIAVRLTVRAASKNLVREFVVTAPLDEGVPVSEREDLLAEIIRTPEDFLNYVRFLLGDGLADALGEFDDLDAAGAKSGSNGGPGGPTGASGFPLFETLVRALETAPERLDQLNSVVEDFRATGNGRRRLPREFLEIWGPIWTAREARRGPRL